MNKVDELIQQLCPEGVGFVKLGEVCELHTGEQFNKRDMFIEGTYPILNGGINPSGFSELYNEDSNTITISQGGASAGYVNWMMTKFWAGAHCFIIKPKEESLNNRFLYFLMKSLEDTMMQSKLGAGIPGLNRSKVLGLEIPVLPLLIQSVIVSILDKFTTLEAELEAELECRKQQYEYYRNKLLSFENDNNVEWKTLGDIGIFIRGNGLQKKDFTNAGIGCIHYGQIYTYYGTSATKTKSFVSKELAATLKEVETGDLIIACTSENVEDVCKCVAWLGKETIVTGGHSVIFKHKQNSKFLSYYFQTEQFFIQKKKYAKGVKVIDIKGNDLAKIKIPVPPLEEQSRIANILDRFEALTTSISEGLPAEIAARKQQYEYYRNKLLTFNRKAV